MDRDGYALSRLFRGTVDTVILETHENHHTRATHHYVLSTLSMVGYPFQFVELDLNLRSDRETIDPDCP